MYKIMIIEDDVKLMQMIKNNLEKFGYETIIIEDFQTIEECFERVQPHLVVLDINLPYYDGFLLCRIFRRKSSVPIIISSARNSEMDQVMGIELGADDYVVKPYSMELLMTKIRASIRRAYGEYAQGTGDTIQLNGFKLYLDSFRLQYRDNLIDLSKNEFRLLKRFFEKPNEVISREELLEQLWDDSSFVDDNTLTVNVTRVKNKLSGFGFVNVIKTKRGIGYILDTGALEDDDNE